MPTTQPVPNQWLSLDDPVGLILMVMGAILVVAIIAGILRRGRESAESARRRSWIDTERQRSAAQREAVARQARRIIATSSTGTIAGFEILRQVEAVFTEGHPTPQDAVDALKAAAAERGANALTNLSGERMGTGKCAARGDAVIVKPTGRPPTATGPRGGAPDGSGPDAGGTPKQG